MGKTLHHQQKFKLERGDVLPAIDIAYSTYGQLNDNGSNVIWICHALTADSNVEEWWPGMVGSGLAFDTEKYFVVCANILGSCYGSSGPLSINPETNSPYFSSFPDVTIRDMVQAHIILREYLNIQKIELLVGGSMGGYQCLEWALMESARIDKLFLLATSASESAWGIAVHTAQRLALTADPSWTDKNAYAGKNGLKAARAIGMLTYRNYGIMVKQQSDPDTNKMDGYRASSYIEYQGEKLSSRFNAYSYWLLTKAMDSHQLCRNREGSIEQILSQIKQQTLLIGITSDILCPLHEQELMAGHMPSATLHIIDSEYGHDGFLVEVEKISASLATWLLL